jgi:hypothetical protein
VLERVEESAPALSEVRLRSVERELGVALPDDYRSFLLKHNGGRPFPAGLLLPVDGTLVPWRLHFFLGIDDPVESCSLTSVHRVTEPTRPAGTIPVASNEGGNLFYLRCADPSKGRVYFGATPADGRGVRPVQVSESFSQFIEMLCDLK